MYLNLTLKTELIRIRKKVCNVKTFFTYDTLTHDWHTFERVTRIYSISRVVRTNIIELIQYYKCIQIGYL
jgi:hypothetical protein